MSEWVPGPPWAPVTTDLQTEQTDPTPTAKVAAGALAGAFMAVLISIAKSFGIELEPELAAGLVTIFGGLAAYFKKSRPGELDQ